MQSGLPLPVPHPHEPGRVAVQNPVAHSYDFVDFVPYVPPYITFEPCEMLPGGEGCDCIDLGCTAPSPEGVTFFTEPNGASVSADNTAATHAAAPCIDSHSGTEHDRELLGVCTAPPLPWQCMLLPLLQ